jgi:hypothetical protein
MLSFTATSYLETGLSRAQGKRRDTGSSISEMYTPIPHLFNDNIGTSDDVWETHG